MRIFLRFFIFEFSAVILGAMAVLILWHRRYRRKWQQFRARSWSQFPSRFDSGDIVPMMKGKSRVIAGYQVWFSYDYQMDGEQIGFYTLPFSGEYPSTEVAEKWRKKLAHREIVVSVSPRNPKRSCVLDRDVKAALNIEK